MSANPKVIKLPPLPAKLEHPLGPIIHAYTRAQALLDGFQVDVSKVAREAGIVFPCFLTREVWDLYVKVPEGVSCQDEQGRLWDIVNLTRFAIRKAPNDGASQIPVALYVKNGPGAARLVKLKAVCGPLDMNKPEPAVTIMLQD